MDVITNLLPEELARAPGLPRARMVPGAILSVGPPSSRPLQSFFFFLIYTEVSVSIPHVVFKGNWDVIHLIRDAVSLTTLHPSGWGMANTPVFIYVIMSLP